MSRERGFLKLKFLKMLEEPKVEWEFTQGWSGVIRTQKPYTGEVQNDIFWISKMFFCVLVWQLYFMFPERGGRVLAQKDNILLQDAYLVVCETNVGVGSLRYGYLLEVNNSRM